MSPETKRKYVYPIIAIVVATLAVLASSLVCIRTGDLDWVPASGSVVTLSGVWLGAKTLSVGFGGTNNRLSREDWITSVLISCGTLLWAYGGIVLR